MEEGEWKDMPEMPPAGTWVRIRASGETNAEYVGNGFFRDNRGNLYGRATNVFWHSWKLPDAPL